ncbi:uncharacterized protein LOC123934615 [Meles meles]|uniref:uncharacterized protein LOC123934615 n=1 Tax=Meles meles TaxID=9662 RepID=UPI001E6A088A|nr:uncharacterized protein LOC123934615 [Meles meles]
MQDLRIQRQTRFSRDHPCGTTSVPLTQVDSPSEASDWLFCRLGSPGAVKMGRARYVPVLRAADPSGNKLIRGPRPCGALFEQGRQTATTNLVNFGNALSKPCLYHSPPPASRCPPSAQCLEPAVARTHPPPTSPTAGVSSAFPYSSPTTRPSRRITTTGATARCPQVSGALPLLSPRCPRSERGARARRRGEGAGSTLSMDKMGHVGDSDPVRVPLRREAATRACEHFARRVAHSGAGRAGTEREWRLRAARRLRRGSAAPLPVHRRPRRDVPHHSAVHWPPRKATLSASFSSSEKETRE